MIHMNIENHPRYIQYLYHGVMQEIYSLNIGAIEDSRVCYEWDNVFMTLIDQLDLVLKAGDISAFEVLVHLAHMRIDCAKLMVNRGLSFTPHDFAVAEYKVWRTIYECQLLPE